MCHSCIFVSYHRHGRAQRRQEVGITTSQHREAHLTTTEPGSRVCGEVDGISGIGDGGSDGGKEKWTPGDKGLKKTSGRRGDSIRAKKAVK